MIKAWVLSNGAAPSNRNSEERLRAAEGERGILDTADLHTALSGLGNSKGVMFSSAHNLAYPAEGVPPAHSTSAVAGKGKDDGHK